jgi:outer membrane immunogenic protein
MPLCAVIWGVQFVRELVMFTAVAVVVGAADLASAADLGDTRNTRDWRDPSPVSVHLTNWTGFYIGAGIGGAMFSTQVNSSADNGAGGFFGSADLGRQGFLGSVHTGYDVQFPISRWVAGAFFDYDWLSVQAEQNLPTSNGLGLAEAFPAIQVSLDREWSVGGRIGYLYTPDMLVYGLAAYTSQSGSLSGTVTFPTGHRQPFDESLDFGGWTVGAGVETRLRDNWSLKLEYRYTQFDGMNGFDATNGGCGAVCSRSLNDSMDDQTVRLLLTYKFNRW